MANSINLRKTGVGARMASHPLATVAGAITTAALFGALGTAHGNEAGMIMAGLGLLVGAPLGAFISASMHQGE